MQILQVLYSDVMMADQCDPDSLQGWYDFYSGKANGLQQAANMATGGKRIIREAEAQARAQAQACQRRADALGLVLK